MYPLALVVRLTASVLSNVIVDAETEIENMVIDNSLLGKNVRVKGQGSTNEPGRPDTGGCVRIPSTVIQIFAMPSDQYSFHYAGQLHQIRDVLAESKTENGYRFTVLTEARHHYQLIYDEYHDAWQIKPITD